MSVPGREPTTRWCIRVPQEIWWNVLKISENGWLQINCLHGVGWCAAQYIQWSPFESQQPPIGIGRCTADRLNVRTGSGLDYPAAFQLSQGNMVDVLTASGQWLQINCLLGSGWCASQYIDWFRTNLQVPAIGVGKCTADVLEYPFGPGHGSFRTVHYYFRRQYGGCAGG